MGTVRETAVSVRFGGDDLDPDEITKLLGTAPDAAHRRGDAMPQGRGVWRSGLWSCQAPRVIPGDLDAQVARLFAMMTPDLSVWRDLCTRYRGDVFCGLFLEDSNEGIVLSTEAMRAIADRSLTLGLDIYHTGD